MREILFRAKRLDNGEWVEGYLVYDEHDNLYRIVIKLEYSTGTHIDTMFAPRVSSKTIGQYTGLKDKNGTKIFEGNILRNHSNPVDLSLVCFGEFGVIDVETEEVVDKVVGWYTKVIPTDELSKCKPFCYDMPLTDYYIERCEAEVIGNIHDYPDLLKGGVSE